MKMQTSTAMHRHYTLFMRLTGDDMTGVSIPHVREAARFTWMEVTKSVGVPQPGGAGVKQWNGR